MPTPITPQPDEVIVLAGQYSRSQTTTSVFTAKASQFTRTSPARPTLDIVKEVLDNLGVQGDYVTYAIYVFNTSGQLITVIVDALQGSFTDIVNGGSSSGTFQVPRNFVDVGWINYDYRVQFYLNDSIDPWYDGYVSEFDQTQDDDEYDHDSITVITDGWSTFMSRAIVTETLSPGVQSNGVDNGIEYADEYLLHLITTYLDSEHFGTSFVASMPIGLDAISFDGTGLDQCIDTVVKQVLNESGNLYEWWVRGTRYGLPQLIIQPQQDPALVTESYYTPARKIASAYFPEYKNSTMYDYSIQNSAADLANQIALYGGQDPTTGLTVYGPFKDSTSISLYGLRQKQVTDTSLISTASLSNYATAYLIMNGYPQPQGTFKKFAPTDQMRSGQWLQIMEPGIQDTGETFIIGTNEISTTHPQNVKQVRVIQVVTSFGQSEDGDRIEQEVSFTAPRPYIDQAYYAAIGAAATTQQSQQAAAANSTKVSQTYLQAGLDYVSNDSSTTPPTVTFTPPTGVFYGGTTTVSTGGSNITLPLKDSSSLESGDGTYHVVFAQNQNESFGTGPSGPGLQVVKGLPPAYDNGVIPGWRFSVQNGSIIGNKDLRVQGGIGKNNYQPGSIPSSALQSGALTDVAVTSLNTLKGDVTIESTDSSVDITVTGESINLSVTGASAGVSSLQGKTGAVVLDSPDSSIAITSTGDTIHLEAVGGGVGELNGLTGDLTIESTDGSLTVTASGTDINIENNGVKSVNGEAGALTIDSPDSSISVTPSGSDIHLEAAVKSVQGATGAVTFNSPDSSVTISESGGVIHLEAAGGGGGVSSINSKTGAVSITSPDSSVTIGSSGSNITLEVAGGGGGGGVTSLAGETGAITLGSSDSSVTITPSAGHIDLKAAGGGGGGGITSTPLTFNTHATSSVLQSDGTYIVTPGTTSGGIRAIFADQTAAYAVGATVVMDGWMKSNSGTGAFGLLMGNSTGGVIVIGRSDSGTGADVFYTYTGDPTSGTATYTNSVNDDTQYPPSSNQYVYFRITLTDCGDGTVLMYLSYNGYSTLCGPLSLNFTTEGMGIGLFTDSNIVQIKDLRYTIDTDRKVAGDGTPRLWSV